MKSFHLTIYSILALFLLIMGGVATTAFMHTSNSTRVDPAQINHLREEKRVEAKPHSSDLVEVGC